MVDYILEGFGNHGDWSLSNAHFRTYLGNDTLTTGDNAGDGDGYGYRSINALYFNNWNLEVQETLYAYTNPPEVITDERVIWLEGDSNPITFRDSYIYGGSHTYSIIYDGDVKDQYVGYGSSYIIKKRGTIYYFRNGIISFDYGSIKKPVKLKLATTGGPVADEFNWIRLEWYYTGYLPIVDSGDFCFAT